ncbi:uncharacterized protein LOC135928003 [Gordionus sp. m RMFG-2023]|uniref:uncharacterized protein LOC135928003 n=1 Tax=Gordionus sp. m RMFG-2023 TaxID=3053472 RepID=UPI0031FD3713
MKKKGRSRKSDLSVIGISNKKGKLSSSNKILPIKMGIHSQPNLTLVENPKLSSILSSNSKIILPIKMGLYSQPNKTFVKNAMTKDTNNIPQTLKFTLINKAHSNTNQKGCIPFLENYLPRPNVILDQIAHKYRPLKTSFKKIQSTQDPIFIFQPTTSEWKKYHSEILGLTLNAPQNSQNLTSTNLGDPDKVDQVLGDGNCLFRCISKEISNNEEYHEMIRMAIISFMMQHSNYFSGFIGIKTTDYIVKNKMGCSGTWATDVEIACVSTLLQTRVFVFYNDKWLAFDPLFIIPEIKKFFCCIYIKNKNYHYNLVLSCK